MNCSLCGKFMKEGITDDSPLEDEVLKWWFCKCGSEYPEHLYFKSEIKSTTVLCPKCEGTNIIKLIGKHKYGCVDCLYKWEEEQ